MNVTRAQRCQAPPASKASASEGFIEALADAMHRRANEVGIPSHFPDRSSEANPRYVP